jgi:hypothetical protein
MYRMDTAVRVAEGTQL